MTVVATACSCGAYAIAATIFYKKNFQRSGLPAVFLGLVVGLLLDTALIPSEVTAFGITIAAVLLLKNDEWIWKAFKTDVFLAFLVAICDVRYGIFDWATGLLFTKGMSAIAEKNCSRVNPLEFNLDMHTEALSQLDPLSVQESSSTLTEALLSIKPALSCSVPWEMSRVILVAIPQFLRKPTWLKAKLQGLRSKLGPMYVLFVASFIFSRWGSHDNMFADMFGLFVAMVAFVAGTVFRPDNATMFDLFGVKSTLSKRQYLHGQCMIVTLVSCCVMFVIELLF